MEEITKAYLINIKTKWVNGRYYTMGLYSFGCDFLFTELLSLKNETHPILIGDIADVFYTCHIVNEEPFSIYFEAFLNSPMIRPGIEIERLTQAQAFEQCIRNRYQQLKDSSSFCDELFSVTDSLGINKIMSNYDEKKIKRMHKLISKRYIPCSAFVLNTVGDYVKCNRIFSELDIEKLVD